MPEPIIHVYSDKVEFRRDFASSEFEYPKGKRLWVLERSASPDKDNLIKSFRASSCGDESWEEFVTDEPAVKIEYQP